MAVWIFKEGDSREIIDGFVDLVFLHFGFYCAEDSPCFEKDAFSEDGKFYFCKTDLVTKGRDKALPLVMKTRFRPAPKEFLFFGRKSLGLFGIVSELEGAVDLFTLMNEMFGEKES